MTNDDDRWRGLGMLFEQLCEHLGKTYREQSVLEAEVATARKRVVDLEQRVRDLECEREQYAGRD